VRGLGLTVTVEPAEMVLYGPVEHQAALCGLLDRIRSHALEVVEVRRLPTTPDELGANPSHRDDGGGAARVDG
jgi:hypothetical protein